MSNTKQDLSDICNGQVSMVIKRDRKEISEEEFIQWYNDNCAKCIYESEICMKE